MKRFFKKPSSEESTPDYAEDSPEGILLREMATFCEGSGAGPSGNEFVHLPRIVESAESSPAAAKEAASRIRRYLSTPTSTPNHVQYNAIMLMRILADNPGHSFTRNFDAKYVSTLKDLLRYGRDYHVQHYLRQYLNTLEDTKASDPDLQLLLQMWAKEKTKNDRKFIDRFPMASNNQGAAAGYAPQLQGPRSPPPANSLPDAGEMAARVEEARNSAKLLTQFVQTTPQAEIETNDLISEFVDRCRTSSRLIQSYIHSINPAPDEDTLLTLIEANDEISVAMSQQQRAMLKARKARGAMSPNSNVNSLSPTASETVASPSSRPASLERAQRASRSPEQQSAPLVELPSIMPGTVMSGGRPNAPRTNSERYEYSSTDFEVQNPFADDYATNNASEQRQHPLTSNPPQEHVAFQPTEQGRLS